MDDYKREQWKQYGKMYDKDCPCCNWTLRKKKRLYTKMINRSAKAKLKNQLKQIIKNME